MLRLVPQRSRRRSKPLRREYFLHCNEAERANFVDRKGKQVALLREIAGLEEEKTADAMDD